MGKNPRDELCKWARRTTMEGLPNIASSTTGPRMRIFWTLALLSVSVVGLVHLAMAIRNFLDSSVTSNMKLEASPAEFPDVTICGLSPLSEAKLWYYGSVVNQHLEYHWGYFDNWFVQLRRRMSDEKEYRYVQRVKKLFSQLLQILWVSDDVKDLGMSDRISIVDCTYNGQECDHRNFSLLQHYKYWNCYTFSPETELKMAGYVGEHEAGLAVSIFTGDNIFPSAFRTNTSYVSTADSRDYRSTGLSLKEFLTSKSGEFPMNSLVDQEFKTDGALVFLHSNDFYPLHLQSFESFVLQNGRSGAYRIETVERTRLNRKSDPCVEGTPPRVEYVVSFGSEPHDIKLRGYQETAYDKANERLQQEVHGLCGCYSHTLPFHTVKSQLCYYVPPHYRKTPSEEILRRIGCHDKWAALADDDRSFGKYIHQTVPQCRGLYREVQSDTMTWPTGEDILPATAAYISGWRSVSGTQSVTSPGKTQHGGNHVFNFSNSRVNQSLLPGQKLISFEDVAARSLLRGDCAHLPSISNATMRQLRNCVDETKAHRNFLRISVKLASTGGVSYTETATYDNWEILSEIGGILGLWFGISLMTVLEFVELLVTMAISRRSLLRCRQQLEFDVRQAQLDELDDAGEQIRQFDEEDQQKEDYWLASVEMSQPEFDGDCAGNAGTADEVGSNDSAVATVHREPSLVDEKQRTEF